MTITALGIGTLQNISLLQKIQRLKREFGLCTPSNIPICYENDSSVNSSIWMKLQLRIYVCQLSQCASLQICYLQTLLFIKLVGPILPNATLMNKIHEYQALKRQKTCWGKKEEADE